VLDTLLGYTLRIAPIGLYARFWNQFTTINWVQHYFIILSRPWLLFQWTSQVNLLSILHLSWHNYPALFSLVSFYILVIFFTIIGLLTMMKLRYFLWQAPNCMGELAWVENYFGIAITFFCTMNKWFNYLDSIIHMFIGKWCLLSEMIEN
jgi:hypothetical protein